MPERQRLRNAMGWTVTAAAIAAGVFWYEEDQEATRRAAEARELARAISVLPPGIEDAWIEFVDRRLATTLQRQGGTIRLSADFDTMLNKVTIISVNKPYEITCDEFEGAIRFGESENATTVTIYGTSVPEARPPSLGVLEDSIAAKALREQICDRIAQRLESLTRR